MSNLYEAHKQWAFRPSDQRFTSLGDLAGHVKARRARSRSVVEPVKRVIIDVDAELQSPLIDIGNEEHRMTHYSFGQVCQTLGAPAAYLRTLPAALVMDNLRHGLQKAGEQELKFLSIVDTHGEGPSTLQAVTSARYGRIWDADVVDAAGRIVDRTSGRFYNPKAYNPDNGQIEPSGLYASDHDVFIFMIDGGSLLEVGERAKLNRGFIMSNSETGARTFTLMTFLFNVVCGNHIIWGAQDVNKLIIRHTSNGPYRFDAEAAPLLLEYANSSCKSTEDVVKRAMERKVGEDELSVTTFIRERGFNRTEASQAILIAKTQEGDFRSLWNVVQGLTALAKTYDFVDSRVDLEQRAGKLLKMVE